MATLSFSLDPGALVRLHDALSCLSKFSESVSIEAEYDLLRLSALNTTKTAYAAFVFDADKFFSRFSFSLRRNTNVAARNQSADRFSCQIYLKALLSVFKGRTAESRDKDTAIERCDVELHDTPDQAECRLVIKMICGQGVVKSYKLTYEPAAVQHAVFDRSRSRNQWTIESKFLREIIDHFSPSAEQLDIYPDGGKAVFTSFTTKVTEGKEILKQPVHTSVAIDAKDFEEFMVEDGLHVAINVKDFKAAVIHAETVKTSITARYTRPCRPLQLAYEAEGITCEFTLMTRGEVDDDDTQNSSRAASQLSARPAQQPVSVNSSKNTSARDQMPPPPSRSAQPSAQAAARKPEVPPSAASRPSQYAEFDSLFVPADDDRQWDEHNYEEDAEDTLGWDVNADTGVFKASPGGRDNEPVSASENRQERATVEDEPAIPPTQRISQVRDLGLFD
ncbi:hypothetical protein VTN77DRAFT_1815 [Rasamsonia byssochlamydoides]|uniref:uncharacterized protein n=1 Tax=Rasamsonia byssochlamydoides TaxID=89139 RepID=UPI003744375F